MKSDQHTNSNNVKISRCHFERPQRSRGLRGAALIYLAQHKHTFPFSFDSVTRVFERETKYKKQTLYSNQKFI